MAISLVLLVAVLVGGMAVVSIFVAWTHRPDRPSWPWVAISAVPALVMFGVFYSLAGHMHQALGGWPEFIGDREFPPSLKKHGEIASWYFVAFLGLCVLGWPTAFAVCWVVRRLREAVFYLGIFALGALLFFGSMFVAPSDFMQWWWD